MWEYTVLQKPRTSALMIGELNELGAQCWAYAFQTEQDNYISYFFSRQYTQEYEEITQSGQITESQIDHFHRRGFTIMNTSFHITEKLYTYRFIKKVIKNT